MEEEKQNHAHAEGLAAVNRGLMSNKHHP